MLRQSQEIVISMAIDSFCITTRHPGRTLTPGRGIFLIRFLRQAVKQKATSFAAWGNFILF